MSFVDKCNERLNKKAICGIIVGIVIVVACIAYFSLTNYPTSPEVKPLSGNGLVTEKNNPFPNSGPKDLFLQVMFDGKWEADISTISNTGAETSNTYTGIGNGAIAIEGKPQYVAITVQKVEDNAHTLYGAIFQGGLLGYVLETDECSASYCELFMYTFPEY
jgi:hypothetical protein